MCTVTIVSVFGMTGSSGGPLTSLSASGTSSGCPVPPGATAPQILVEIECQPQPPLQQQVSIDTMTGDWMATWTGQALVNFPCSCGSEVTVIARCVADTACSDVIKTNIECCGHLNVTLLQTETDPCDANGTRQEQFTANISGGSYTGVTWTLPDGSTDTSNPSVQRSYSPGTYTLRLTVHASGCPDTNYSWSITVKSCGTPPPPPPPASYCRYLLALALLVLASGAILILIGVCLNDPYVYIPGIVAAAIGLGLLALWAYLCGFSECSILKILIHVFNTISVILLFIAPLLNFVGLGGLCSIGAIVDWGVFNQAASILTEIGFAVGCIK